MLDKTMRSIRLGLILATLAAASGYSATDRPKPCPNADAGKDYVVHAPSGKITAHFVLEESTTVEPFVTDWPTHLYFTFASDKHAYEFKAKGKLFSHPCCWFKEVFSPSGRFVVLLQDHCGPLHIVASEHLKEYLRGKRQPDQIIATEIKDENDEPLARVTRIIKWIDKDSFEYGAGCCGHESHYRRDIDQNSSTFLYDTPVG